MLAKSTACLETVHPLLRPEFVQLVHFRGTGKPVSPTTGSKKYNQILIAGQIYTDAWLNEPNVEWASLYDFRNSGTVTATDTFALDNAIRTVSKQEGDIVRILHTDGNESEYELVPVDRLRENRYNTVVAWSGRNLVFSKAFTASDPQIGGTIVVPSYGYATFPTDDVTAIPVDDPYWLVDIAAAEFVRNDITRKQEYPNLVGSAAERMAKMKENNGDAVDELYRPNFFVTDSEHWAG